MTYIRAFSARIDCWETIGNKEQNSQFRIKIKLAFMLQPLHGLLQVYRTRRQIMVWIGPVRIDISSNCRECIVLEIQLHNPNM
jgi:hypothetical protein